MKNRMHSYTIKWNATNWIKNVNRTLQRKQNAHPKSSSLRSKRFRRAKSEERGFRRFVRAKNGARAKIGRRGWARGQKETLADKPLDFENLCSPANGARDWLG